MLRSARNYNRDVVSRETGMPDDQEKYPSRTVQSEKDNCDINVIMKRFGVTKQMPAVTRIPEYGDYSGVSDFHSAMTAVRVAEESFMELPASVREEFNNSPQKYLEFCSKPENQERMIELGIATRRPADKIVKVHVTNEVFGERDVGEGAPSGAQASGDAKGKRSGKS